MKNPFTPITYINKRYGVQVQVQWIAEEGGGTSWVPTRKIPSKLYTPVVRYNPERYFNNKLTQVVSNPIYI